ncbi:hypothetical protein MASR1M59_23290 [Melaminivora sp.]
MIAATALAAASLSPAGAEPIVFDTSSNSLVIPEVKIGNTSFYNVRLRFDADSRFTLTEFTQGPTDNTIARICSAQHINFTKYAALNQLGATFTKTQADQAIGCLSETVPGPGSHQMYLRWFSSGSSSNCPQYIEMGAEALPSGDYRFLGKSMIGIDPETNKPYPC